MHARPARRAFTLVELIVVVVILGILAGIGLVSYQQVTKRAQDKSIEATVTSLAGEAQALAASRADGVFTPDDLNKAVGDLPTLVDGAPGAAAWDVKTAPYAFVTAYGQLHVRLAADGSAAGIAAMSLSGNCLLARFTPTGRPTARFVGAVGASCSGDTALAAAPDAPINWTDPTTAGPPARPTGLADTITAGGVVLTWTANTETDLAGYRITVDHVAQPELLSVPTATIPAVPGEHTVTVVAVDKSALASDPSAPLLAAVPPAGPAQVTATVVHGVVTVAWTAAPGATSYRIWHQVGTSAATILGQVLAPATTLTDGDLPAGASVTYSVAAANAGGESAATVAGAALTAPTEAPTAVTAAASGTSISGGGTAPAGATGFRVYRDGAPAPVWAGTAGSFTDTGLAEGVTHSYVVTATNAGGESAPSTAVSATTVPGTPAGLTTTVSDGSIDLSWQPTPAAVGYRVYRSTDGATFALLAQVTDGTSVTDNLPAGASASYTVAAYDSAGESAQSTAVVARTRAAAPTGVTATATGTSITISWTAPAGATSFTVYRDGSATPAWTGTGTSWADTGLAAGSTHSYVVTATNAAGESAGSGAASATTAPATPAGLAATAGDGSIDLTWQQTAAAAGYRVYRSTDGATFTLLGQAPGTTFTDGSLVNGTHYWYAVAAYNGAGESGQSTAASSTPLPPVPAVPAGVTTDVTGTAVTISWAPVDRADGYRVYKNGALLAQVTSGTSATDTVPAGSSATYSVSAYNLAGESGQSALVTARTKSTAPTGVTATASGTTIAVAWTAPAGATSFAVYRDSSSTPAWAGTGTSWADTGLAAGTTHSYAVTALNSAGESTKSYPASAVTVPVTPTGLTATAGDNTVSLSWPPALGAQTFRVYRSADGGAFTLLAQASTRSYTDATAVNGTSYSYAVSAVNGAGESGQSAPATATPLPPLPAVPSGVSTSVTGTTVTVSWSAVSRADGYRLYKNGTYLQQVSPGSATSATDTLAAGSTATYSVSAYNLSGESGQSGTSSATATATAPTGVTATASGTTITVAWTAPAGATGYKVYRDGAGTATWTGTATSWADTGLAVGSTHTYVVTATNAAGESPASATASATTAPGTPTGLTATAGDNTVALTWNPSAAATGYRLYRSVDGTTFTQLAQVSGTSFTDATAANGTTYWYAVSAYNPAGESGQSTAATTKPLPPMPAVPTGVTTTMTGGMVTIDGPADGVTVSWTAVARADGYRIYKNGTLLRSVGAVTSTDDSVPEGSTTSYTVAAYNLAGTSAQSAPVTAIAAPAQPTATATAAGSTVTVSWPAVSGATTYNVYSKGSADSGWTSQQTTGTSYTYTTLAVNTPYSFYVIASNTGGISAASATVTATTGQEPVISSSSSWSTLTPADPVVRYGAATSVDAAGRVYVFGGSGSSSGTPQLSTAERYDPGTNAWTTIASMPFTVTASSGGTGTDGSGRIYVFGGVINGVDSSSTVYRYDPATNAWSTVASMPAASNGGTITTDDRGRIYYVGGNLNAVKQSHMWRYDPSANTWTTLAPVPQNFYGGVAAFTNGKLYAFSGINTVSGPVTYSANGYVYDPSANTWSTAPAFPVAGGLGGIGTALDSQGRIYAIAGNNSATSQATAGVYRFDPKTNAWSTLPSLTTPRRAASVVSAPSGIYVIGGANASNTAVNTVERFR